SDEAIIARLLLLATGLEDQLPEIKGFGELYGKSVHSCPYCHGWECRGQAMAIYGRDEPAANLAIELLQWSKNLVLCTDGPPAWPASRREELERLGIVIDDRHLLSLEHEEEKLTGINFAGGGFLSRDALFLMPKQCQRTSLAEGLGCEISMEDGCLQCGDSGETIVPGLYVAGNTRQGQQLVIAAVAQGTLAAAAMNNALIDADTGTG
ncbi:MAG: hypothetical protein JWO08_2221, partial [Verrucomicrobiaceae bacterium]|nr:hypothetical protein [Verrucomicrobiaceae bacterium]